MNIDIIDIDTIDATQCRIDGFVFDKSDVAVSAYGDQHAQIVADGQTFIASIGSAVDGRRPNTQTALLFAINSLVTPAGTADRHYMKTPGAVIWHRGGGAGTAPENSLMAIRYALANGAKAIEVDVQLTTAGHLVCVHDDTLDRTTDGTGSVAAMTASQLDTIRLDPFAPAWPLERIPLWSDVLSEFGGKVLICLDPKDAATLGAATEMALLYGIDPGTIVVNTGSSPWLLPGVKAKGFQTMIQHGDPTIADFGSIYASYQPDYYAGEFAKFTTSNMAACNAAGMHCVAFTISSRYDRDVLNAKGSAAYMADQPLYLLADGALSTTDSFAAKTFAPGMIANTASPGAFIGAAGFQSMDSTADGYQSTLLGSLCPTPASFVLDFDLKIDAVLNDTRWAGIVVCATNDRPYANTDPLLSSGYHCLVRQSGTLDIYTLTAGVGTTGPQSQAGTALTLGATFAMRITVTPTTVKLENVTRGQSVTLTSSAFRGGYLHIGANGATVTYSGIELA